MKQILAALLISAFLFAPFNAKAQQQPEFSITRSYVSLLFVAGKASIFTPNNKEAKPDDEVFLANGSAVVISPTLALTAAHMFNTKFPNAVMKLQRDDKEIPVTLVKKDDEKDIALISGDFKCPCAPISTNAPVIDRDAFLVGFPLYSFYELQILTRGFVQGYTGGDDKNFLAITASMAPGGSGGGAFVKEGDRYVLVGVISSIGAIPVGPTVLKIQQQMNWITFVVTPENIRAFLKGVKLD